MFKTRELLPFSFEKISLLIMIGIIAGFLSILNPFGLNVPLIIVSLGISIFIITIFIYESQDSHFLFRLLISALLARLFICLLLHLLGRFKYGHGFFLGADDYGYSLNASQIVSVWKETGHLPKPNSLPWMPAAGNLNYTYFLSVLYFFIEENPLIPLFINSIAGTFTIFFIYSIANQFFDYKVAQLSAIFVAFWPSLFLWSTQNLKEPLTVLFISIAMWSVIKLINNFRFTYLILGIISFFIIYTLRISAALFLFISFLISFLLFSLLSSRPRALLVILLLFIFLFLYKGNWFNLKEMLSQKIEQYFFSPSLEDIFIRMNYLRQVRMLGARTSFLQHIDISKPLNFFLFFPLGLSYALFSPFPWQIHSLNEIVSITEIFLWYLLTPFTFIGVKIALRNITKRRQVLFIFIFIILMLILLAVVEGNVGTLFRHRAFIWPFLLIFSAIGVNSAFTLIRTKLHI